MNTTIIMRHSNRPHIVTPEDFATANLTFTGKINAFKAGRFLKDSYKIDEIHSSFRQRCYDTATLVSLGYSPFKNIPITREQGEFDTLCAGFVKNMDEWNHLSMNHDFFIMFYGNMNALFTRYKPYNVFKHDSATPYAQEVMKKYLKNKNILAIAHDSTIAPLWVTLSGEFGFRLNGLADRPGFLNGIVIHHVNGEIQRLEKIDAKRKAIRQIYPPQN